MPILDVQIVGEVEPAAQAGLAQRLAEGAAAVFGGAPRSTWVKVTALAANAYAENGGAAPVRPVFVSVLKRELPRAAALEREIGALTAAIAAACGRPAANVHVIYEAAAAGRVAFGGILVSRRTSGPELA